MFKQRNNQEEIGNYLRNQMILPYDLTYFRLTSS